MKKKMIPFLLIALLLSSIPVQAEENGNGSKELKDLFLESTFEEKTEDGCYIYSVEYVPNDNNLYRASSNQQNSRQMAKTTFMIVPNNEEDEEIWDAAVEQTRASSGGNKGAYAWDSTGGVKIFSTIYYSESVSYDRTYTHLDKITGGYEKADRSLSVVSQEITYGATQPYLVQTKVENVTGTSWTIIPPSSWEAIDTSQTLARILGVNSYVTIKRNSGSWTVTLLNNLYGNMGSLI